MTTPTSTQIKQFVTQVKASGKINFPVVAHSMNMDWFRDFYPLLEDKNGELYLLLSDALMSIKYELLDKLLISARDGKMRGGRTIEPSYIKAMIQYIDSGVLLGKADFNMDKDEETPPVKDEDTKKLENEMSEEAYKAHIRRLGLDVPQK